MKECTRCFEFKDMTSFYKQSNGTSYYTYCKQCTIRKAKEYYVENRESALVYKRKWEKNNPDKVRLGKLKYESLNKDKRCGITAKYRASRLNATLKNLSIQERKNIDEIYKQAKELEKQDGIKRHVDHCIPLQGKTVCGLHVPWNLQILTAEENRIKSNSLSSNYRR